MRQRESKKRDGGAGFSLLELVVAMGVTLVLMTIAASLMAATMNIRRRENQRTDAIADVQRSVNIMSREIANAGFNLTTNGVVPSDSGLDAAGNGTIRVRANLNKYNSAASQAARDGIGTVGDDAGEDVKFFLRPADNTTYLVRFDPYAATAQTRATVLANRIDALRFFFYPDRVHYATGNCNNLLNPTLITNVQTPAGTAAAQVPPEQARYVVIATCVHLDAVGTPGQDGYQPRSSVLLVSDVALRHAYLARY